MPKSKNHIIVDEKIEEKKGEPIGFHEYVVIIQRKLMFPKRIGCKLTLSWSDTP